MSGREQLLHYGLELPTQRLIFDSLRRYLDDDEVPVAWANACRRAGISATNPPERAEDWLPFVDALESCGELEAVCAKGLRIRIMSYLVLSRSVPTMAAPLGL